MRYFLVMATALSFLGCGEEFAAEKPEAKDQRTSVSAFELKDHISVVVENGSEPERYVVHFGWPRIEPVSQVRIKADRVLGVVKADQTIFSHTVSHDQLLTYVFEVVGATGEVVDKFVKKIAIPADFVVTEKNNIFQEDKILKINRLFLGEQHLVTNGHKITLNVGEIHSQNGVIESFPENSRAKDDTDGRSAGELILNANFAQGELKITMRGEDGGSGSKGAPIAAAAGGVPASGGSFVCDPPVSKVLGIFAKPSRFCGCELMGQDGGPGANGGRGNDGLPGKAGGDSGYAKVQIQNGAELRVSTFSTPGLAGNAGPAGDGQPGGPGGRGSDERCGGGPGPNGATGSAGNPGTPGVPGKKGTFCTYIASEKFNECEQ